MAEKRKKNFRMEMVLTGIHGLRWPNATYLIVTVKKRNGTFKEYYDSRGRHAEMNMLSDSEFLEAVKTGEVDIIVTSNYSPCSECAPHLKDFYSQYGGKIQNFTIRFSFLYYIDEQRNKEGLKNLNKAGITLEAMNDDSWNEIGVRFKELKEDADWENKIRKKRHSWLRKCGKKIELEKVELEPDWTKEKIREKISERDKQTRLGLENLLPASPAVDPGVKALTQKTRRLNMQEK